MDIELPIKRRLQKPSEAYCGPLTYCAITNTNPSNPKAIHEKARLKPSIGFFHFSFLKLDKKTKAHIEKKKTSSKIKKSNFDTMWEFEKPFQKISKEKFIKELLKKIKILNSEYKRRIIQYEKITPNIAEKIIIESLKKKSPAGAMIMENINKHQKIKGTFMIPHWVTIHGVKKDKFLVYNSYLPKSKWVNKKSLSKKIVDVRKHGFTPQMITL
jgi:hypothetical protein